MKILKQISLLILLLTLTGPVLAQKEFKLIRKAEQKYKNEKFDHALRLLKRAESMSYGICGNAWIEATWNINFLKAKIYVEQKEYQLAKKCLDTIKWGIRNNELESLIRITSANNRIKRR